MVRVGTSCNGFHPSYPSSVTASSRRLTVASTWTNGTRPSSLPRPTTCGRSTCSWQSTPSISWRRIKFWTRSSCTARLDTSWRLPSSCLRSVTGWPVFCHSDSCHAHLGPILSDQSKNTLAQLYMLKYPTSGPKFAPLNIFYCGRRMVKHCSVLLHSRKDCPW